MRAIDIIGDPCSCGECRQAGISHEPIRRDPKTGAWMHGYTLKAWYEARAKFYELAKAHGPKAMDVPQAGQPEKPRGRSWI